MGIAIETPGVGGPPAVKFGDVGDHVVVGLVNVEQVQSRDYDSGDLEFWDDGKPKMHPRITGIVVSSQGAVVGKDDDERPVEPGELISIYAQGSRLYTWRDAAKAHGQIEVGDVLRWKFDRTEKPRNPRFAANPVKVFTAELRKPKGTDGDLLERCEAAHYELSRGPRIAVDAGPGSGGGNQYVEDEEPFLRLGDRDLIHRDLHLEL